MSQRWKPNPDATALPSAPKPRGARQQPTVAETVAADDVYPLPLHMLMDFTRGPLFATALTALLSPAYRLACEHTVLPALSVLLDWHHGGTGPWGWVSASSVLLVVDGVAFVLWSWLTHLVVFWATAAFFLHHSGSGRYLAVLWTTDPTARQALVQAPRQPRSAWLARFWIPTERQQDPPPSLIVDAIEGTFAGILWQEPLFLAIMYGLMQVRVITAPESAPSPHGADPITNASVPPSGAGSVAALQCAAIDPLSLPSLGNVMLTFALATISDRLLFYWTHRLLHESAYLYKLFHKHHHRFKGCEAISAEYATMGDNLITGLPPLILCWLFRPACVLQWMVWFWWRTFESLEAHSGFCFKGSVLSKLGFLHQRQAQFHQYHHTHNIGNYGLEWTDRLFGTCAPYMAHRRSLLQQQQAKVM